VAAFFFALNMRTTKRRDRRRHGDRGRVQGCWMELLLAINLPHLRFEDSARFTISQRAALTTSRVEIRRLAKTSRRRRSQSPASAPRPPAPRAPGRSPTQVQVQVQVQQVCARPSSAARWPRLHPRAACPMAWCPPSTHLPARAGRSGATRAPSDQTALLLSYNSTGGLNASNSPFSQ